MAKYKGRFELGGTTSGRSVDWLKPGDEVQIGKSRSFRIEQAFTYENRKVYVTDSLGIVYGDELVVYRTPIIETKDRKIKAV